MLHGVYPALLFIEFVPDVSSAALLAPSGFRLCEVRKLTKTARPENMSSTKFPLFKFELMLSFNRLLGEQRVLTEVVWEGETILLAFFYFFKFAIINIIWDLTAALSSETGTVLLFLMKAAKSYSHDWFLFGVK